MKARALALVVAVTAPLGLAFFLIAPSTGGALPTPVPATAPTPPVHPSGP